MATTKVTTNVIADDAVTTAKILDDNVTYAKMQDTSTNNRVLGAATAGTIAEVQVATDMIADDAVSYAKMGAEFTTSAALSGTEVDWATAAVFTKTIAANTTLTFSNVSTGMVIDLVITGNYTLTLPTSVKEISGTYDGTVSNLIQIVSTNGNTEQWATINQEAV